MQSLRVQKYRGRQQLVMTVNNARTENVQCKINKEVFTVTVGVIVVCFRQNRSSVQECVCVVAGVY